MAELTESRKEGLVLSTLLYIFYVIFNFFFQNVAFTWSLGVIPKLQQNMYPLISEYFKYTAYLGYPIFLIISLALYLILTKDKFNGYKLIFLISIAFYIVSLLKGIFGAPRPYFLTSSIIPYEDFSEYGSPSAHAFLCVFGYGYLFYRYNRHKLRKAKEAAEAEVKVAQSPKFAEMDESPVDIAHAKLNIFSSSPEKSIYLNIFFRFFRFLVILVLLSICFGRMYLGMHGLDQVLFGLASGAYLLYALVIYLEDATTDFLDHLIHKAFQHKIKTLIWLAVIYAATTLLPILIYIINVEFRSENENLWWNLTCYDFQLMDLSPCSNANFTYNRVLLECSVIGIPFGIMVGFFISNGNYHPKQVRKMEISTEKFIFRTLIWLLISGVISFIFIFGPKFNNFILRYLFNYNFLFFILGLLIIRLIPYLFAKFNLDVTGDLFKKVGSIAHSSSSVIAANEKGPDLNILQTILIDGYEETELEPDRQEQKS